MTEETPQKKPRRKRRTKAEIEAEKAAKEVTPKKEEKTTVVTSKEVVKEEPVVNVEPTVAKDIPYEPVVRDREAEHARTAEKKERENYIPLTGLAKLRNKYAQRSIIDQRRNKP